MGMEKLMKEALMEAIKFKSFSSCEKDTEKREQYRHSLKTFKVHINHYTEFVEDSFLKNVESIIQFIFDDSIKSKKKMEEECKNANRELNKIKI